MISLFTQRIFRRAKSSIVGRVPLRYSTKDHFASAEEYQPTCSRSISLDLIISHSLPVPHGIDTGFGLLVATISSKKF